MAKVISLYVRNNCGISIKKCCASCNLKGFKPNGKRICTLTHEKVNAQDKCKHWQMADGLINAGRRKGVVKDIYTKEIILH